MNKLAAIIRQIIDFFYRPFAKWMSKQVFRYAACGGGNLVLDWVLYFLIYNFVIGHENVIFSFSHLPFSHLFDHLAIYSFEQVITPHIAALCIVFPITLLTGFWLQKNVTFNGQSDKVQGTKDSLHSIKQLFRYIVIVAVNLAINYFGLKLCVEVWGWYPTPSKMVITIITVIISYMGQKYYTFKVKTEN